MKQRPVSEGHPALNLVASDLFFGLGAVMLVVVAAMSLGLKGMVSRALTGQTDSPEDTREAAAALAVASGQTVLLADEAGLHRLQSGSSTVIAVDVLWQSDLLPAWLADDLLLIIAPSGQDTAFLTFSRASQLPAASLLTLRLPQECREIRQVDLTYLCLS